MIKPFLIRLFAIILPVGVMIGLMNYLIDPANIFSSRKYVGGIADILSSGHNADNVSNYDERLLQEQMILRLKKTPDIVVLGSSRIMEVGNDFFPGKTVLNCGVSHANIYDLISITGLLDSIGRLPGEIIINLDPWLVSEKSTVEWQSLGVYYAYFIRKNDPGENVSHEVSGSNEIHRLSSIFSFSYFQKSAEFLLSRSSKHYYDVGNHIPASYGRFSDGTVCYSSSYKHPDTLKVASDAWNTGKQEGLSKPDSSKIALLNALILFFNEKHVKICFVMLPVHPEFYRSVNTYQPRIFDQYRDLFLNMAKQYDIPVVGDFDALKLRIGQPSFYDMYHCSKRAIQTIGING